MAYDARKYISDLGGKVNRFIQDYPLPFIQGVVENYNPLHYWPFHREYPASLQSTIRDFESTENNGQTIILMLFRPSLTEKTYQHASHYSTLGLKPYDDISSDIVNEIHRILEGDRTKLVVERGRRATGNYGEFDGTLVLSKDRRIRTRITGKVSGALHIQDKTYDARFSSNPISEKRPTLDDIKRK